MAPPTADRPAPPASSGGGSRTSAWLRIGLTTVAATTLIALSLSGTLPSAEEIRDWGEDLGGWAAFVWPLIFAVIVILVPWPLVAGATGLAFGVAAGMALTIAGMAVAVCAQFAIGRFVAGSELRSWLLRRVPGFERGLERNGLLALVYSRITPGVPWGIVNYAAGAAGARLGHLLLATVAGTPKIFAYVALGGSFDDLSSPEAIVAIALLVLTGVGGLVLARRRVAAERATGPPAA